MKTGITSRPLSPFTITSDNKTSPFANVILNSTPKQDDDQKTPTILEVYLMVFKILRHSGSSCVAVILHDSTSDSDPSNLKAGIGGTGGANNLPSKQVIIVPQCTILYYLSKVVSVAHFLFFVTRFFTSFYYLSLEETIPSGSTRGYLHLLALSSYIWAQLMVIGIYFWAHWKRSEICEFFTKLNELDKIVFKNDPTGLSSYLRNHAYVCKRAGYYFPIITVFAMVIMLQNQLSHPYFQAHMTSLFLQQGEGFFSTPWKATLSLLSFTIESMMVLYFFMAIYQFIFVSIIVARSLKWSIEYLSSRSALSSGSVETLVKKFEHLRNIMTEYNSIFSGLFIFCKVMMLIQITIAAYFSLNQYRGPCCRLLIFNVVFIHYATQIFILLLETGTVHKVSGQFKELWLRRIMADDYDYVGTSILNKGRYGYDMMMGQGHSENKTKQEIMLEEESIKMRKLMDSIKLRNLLEGCTPFGFECGSYYIVNAKTVLTFFSIVTSYLIIMLQLQIKMY